MRPTAARHPTGELHLGDRHAPWLRHDLGTFAVATVRAEHQARGITCRPERLPVRVVVGRDPRPWHGKVDAAEAGFRRPLDFPNRRVDIPTRDVRHPDVTIGCRRDRVGQPLVVDVQTDTNHLQVACAREEEEVVAAGDERNRLEVHAAVKDDVRGDTVTVHIAAPSVHVVVPVGTTAPLVHELEPLALHTWPRRSWRRWRRTTSRHR